MDSLSQLINPCKTAAQVLHVSWSRQLLHSTGSLQVSSKYLYNHGDE